MASKISINLDTSKENYLVSKCKQNDDLVLEAFIYENGLTLDLTNKVVTIQALKSDGTYIIQSTGITKTNNKIIANLVRDFSRVPGTTKIEIVLVESSKQNTTFSFYLEVVGSVIKGAVQSGDTVTILEALENKIVEAGTVKQETEQLITSGNAATKGDVAQINASLEQNMKYPNLVDKLEKLIQVRGMYARVASDNSLRIGIGMNETLKSVIEYRFIHNADGLLLLRGVLAGVEDANANRINITLSGTFNTSTSGQAYTTTIGDKFTFEVTGSSIYFKRWCESRGGLWKFTLSNGDVKNVSCYASVGTYKEDVIFDNLPYGTYKCVVEFLGNDTINAPSSTPARGYLFYGTSSTTVLPIRTGKVLPINEASAKYIVSEKSVPDYAIQGRKAGTSTSLEWSPIHGTVTGVSSSISTKIAFNGLVEVSSSNTMPTFVYKEINSFSLLQKFDVYNPNAVSDGVLWKHNLNHIIDFRNPYLTIQNTINLVQDVNFGLGYFGMLPSKQSTMQKLILNDGTEYSTLPTVAQEDYYDYKITSGAFVGENASGSYHACAMDISSVIDAYNVNKSFEPTQKARISFRTDDIAKVYFTALRSATVLKGTKLQCQNRICCVTGIQYPNDSLGI